MVRWNGVPRRPGRQRPCPVSEGPATTCLRLGIEPWSYLRDVLTRLPSTSAEALAELLPDRWQAARQAQTGLMVVAESTPTPSSTSLAP